MKRFAYKALDTSGKFVEGTFDGNDDHDLESYFLKSQLTPLRVVTKEEGNPSYFFTLQETLKRKLLDTELIGFTRQFAAAYAAGMPVAATIDLLASQSVHTSFKAA